MMEDRQFIEFFRQMIREEITAKENGPKLISVTEVANRLDISTIYLTKDIMHMPGFPKPTRLKPKGDLRFYEHEIDEYILKLGERRA